MLDIKLIESNPDDVIKNLNKRGFDSSIIGDVLEVNKKRKESIQIVESTKSEINILSREVGSLKKSGQDASAQMKKVGELKDSMKTVEEALAALEVQLHEKLSVIPNLISDDTPEGANEDSNKEIKKVGALPSFNFEVKDHVALGESLGMLDFETAAKLTGARFVVYKGLLARLERAIANYMIDFHLKKGYEEIIPPFIVNADTLYGTGQLPKFGEDLFKLEGKDWYLIPTAEVPVTNLKREQLFSEEELPLRYVAYTPCFRSEAGSYGKDTRGLIRMHQFSKVEMVNITSEEQSEEAHQAMTQSACEILEELKLPYRLMQLCSGDIGFGSRKTYDLEVWLPAQNKYREISSVSNCWDFQARRAKIRYKKGGKKPTFAHTLNGSGLAVGRTLVAVLENYQQEDGSIAIPEVLQNYMGGIKVIAK
ncbi:MAG: serine--tRNA ligase [Halobacteriovoraceae bacterium]|nr:serine--tRNA ligase [Halobacteriovoraceae bacterium]